MDLFYKRRASLNWDIVFCVVWNEKEVCENICVVEKDETDENKILVCRYTIKYDIRKYLYVTTSIYEYIVYVFDPYKD